MEVAGFVDIRFLPDIYALSVLREALPGASASASTA